MAKVPFPRGYNGLNDVYKQREHLINCFNHEGYVLRTPGIDSVITASGDGCRGAATWSADEKAYFVRGTNLSALESGETLTSIGTIAGTADCVLSSGQVELVIVVKGGNAYTWDGSTLSQITDGDYVASDAVDFIDGRHVFIPSDGSPAFYSGIDDAGNIDSLSFFDAEELPDLNKNVVNIRNTLTIFGVESIERFRTTDDPNNPFARLSGSRQDTGYVSGGTRYAGEYVFIGRRRGQAYAIYALIGQGQIEKISNDVVTEDLNGFTEAQIEAARVNRFEWLGQEFVAWTIASRTYCYVNGNWVFLDSNLDGSISGSWRVNGVAFAYGRFYVGDTDTDNIGKLAASPGEYGSDVELDIRTFYRQQRNGYFTAGAVELDALTGITSDTSIGLSLSRDGRAWSDFHYRSLGDAGRYQNQIRWSPFGGVGRCESFLGINLRTTDQVRFSTEGLYIE